MAALPPDMDPSKTPIMPNPSGAPPNLIDPPDLKDAQLISGVILIITSVSFVYCRLWTNYKLSRKFGFDDYLCVCALILGIGYWALIREECLLGFSRHGYDTPISTIRTTLIKVNLASQIISAPAIWAAKSAILALYLRVFGKVVWLRYTCHTWIVIMALFYSMIAVAAMVYCFPRRGQSWDESVYTGSLKMTWTLPVIGTFSVVADLLILIIPFPILYRLHLTMGKKVSLGLVFATGIVLVILSIVGLYLRILILHGRDPPWDGMRLSIIAAAEIFGTVMVSCAPALSAFWFRFFTESTIWSKIRSTSSSLRSSQLSESASAEPHSPPTESSFTQSYHDDPSSTGITKTTEYNVLETGTSTNHTEEHQRSYNAAVSGGSSSK